MYRIYTLILLFIFSFSNVYSQTWQWANNISGNNSFEEKAIACDQSNNVYIIGTFKGTATFDISNSLTSAANCTDYFIAKYDQNHNLIWVIQGTTSSVNNNNWGRNIVFDNNGYFYLIGTNDQNVSFNGGVSINATTPGISQGFILKINTSGLAISSNVYSTGSGNIVSESLTIDPSNNLVITGNFIGNITFQGGPLWASTGYKNHFVVQYSSSLTFNWAKELLGNNNATKLISVCTCTNQGFYVGGFVRGSLTINSTTLNSRGSTTEDIFVIKIDNSGNVLWIRQAGSTYADRCNELKSDDNGDVYLTGYGTSLMNFDSTGTGLFDSKAFQISGGYDCIVAKYNSIGDFKWAKLLGSAYDQIGYGITVNDNNIAVTGSFMGSIICNNTISTSSTDKDIFIAVLDNNGIPLYCSKAGGTTIVEDRGERIACDNNNIYVSGYYNSNPLTFGTTNLYPNASPNLFLAKHSLLKITSNVTNVTCTGDNNGAIDNTISGGTSPYTYQWNDGITTEDRTNLLAGIYTVTVTAANLAKVTHSFVITYNNSPSTAPSSISATSSTICNGSSTTLSIIGGNLGLGAKWNWYNGSCGGTVIGTGEIIEFNPTNTITYYARAEGTCNTTSCVNIAITVINTSTAPSSISASPSVICDGASSTISFTGGTLGADANWYWYTNSCGVTTAGAGTSITVNPTITTTYFIRAEGTCNTTSCLSIIISVNNLSSAASSASATPSTICNGDPTTLDVSGGNLGSNADWYWYSNSCGGTSEGIGAPLTLNPTVTTTYYVRAEGFCNTTACVNKTVTVNTLSDVPDSAIANPPSACSGGSSTLSFTGGSLGTGANWYWYSGSCGITSAGAGATLTISVTVTKTYWVRAQGTCNTTTCVSTTVTLNTTSSTPTSATATATTICNGASTTLNKTGGTLGVGSDWYWYSGSCGGTFVGNGVPLTVSPTVTTTYYIRAEGPCNTTNCRNRAITVMTLSIAPTSAASNPASICSGASSTLSKTGGSLGTGATWNWFTVSCGGTSAGAGTTIIVTPTISTTYYIRAQGTCNSTTCVTANVTVGTSVVPTSASANPLTICTGSSITLTAVGGTLGTGAIWKWYSTSCGGTAVGTGNPIIISPTISNTYYVRAESTCNTTACVNVAIAVNTPSTSASSSSSSPSTICNGSSITLGITGGTLGVGAIWNWYSGSCGGTYVTSGTAPVLTPTITTTYYLRAENICNTTACVNTTNTVNNLSIIPTSASASPDTICNGSSSTISFTGGSLGTGASWKWYTTSCGGTNAGAGITITVAPTITTTYYVRAEGTCNTTLCVNTTLEVNTPSTAPSGATGTPTTICNGASITLGITGGTLGIGATWMWYLGSCGGTYATSGVAPIITPTISATYYVRAEGLCNTTTCVNKTIVVNNLSVIPTSASASPASICSGSSSTLSFTGGSLGTGANWYWDSGSCGGTSVGVGTTITVSPTIATTYYVRAEGTCNTTLCVNTTVSLNSVSVSASSASAIPSTICDGASTTLNVVGGTLGTGANWNWYTGSCGGTSVGVGAPLTVSPTVNTTYYVRAEGDCNTTTCVNSTVTIRTISTIPDYAISNPTSVCSGGSSTLSFSGGSLGTSANWYWYSGSCGVTSAGAGPTLAVTITTTRTYWVRAQGTCNTTLCVSATVTLYAISVIPTSATANPTTVPLGSSTTLNITGGTLGEGANWMWYDGTCGGVNYVGSGVPLVVIPTASVRYYVRGEGLCNTTACKNIRITSKGLINSGNENDESINNVIDNYTNSLTVYPNPSNEIINIKYSIETDKEVKITIHNTLGNKVIDVVNKSLNKGEYNTKYNVSKLPSGVYMIRMTLGSSIIVKRLVISR